MIKDILSRLLSPYLKYKIKQCLRTTTQKQADLTEIERKRLFYSSFIKAGDVCFDVGANMGNRIDPFLKIGARVIAVEPQKICNTYLSAKYGKKITVIKKGLGESGTIKDFHLSDESILSSFSTEWIEGVQETKRFGNNKWRKSVPVEITTADELINQFGLPSYIKIDVEGYELEVLKGLSHPVAMISYEYTVPEQSDLAIRCLKQIEHHHPKIECNYSVGESMEWTLKSWIDVPEMINHISSKSFIDSDFGDIYVRTKV